jgi:hypothetical protein
VPFFDVYDPRFMDFGVPIAVRGTISFNITDYVSFIKLHRLSQFEVDDFQKQIRDAVVRYVKDTVANAPAAHNIPVIQIESKTAEINDVIEYDIGERLKENYGVTVSGVDIGAIEIDKMSDGYSQLLAVTRDVTTATVQAQTTANIKNIHDKQRIEAEDYEETLHIQREEEQYSQHKQTQTSNFAAYQTEAQTQVGVAGANALGQMGSNGAGSVDLGGNGAGFNPASMMVSMAVGGAIGQNIAGTMNSMMNGQSMAGSVPPPVPTVAYHVVVNGQATGPFGITALRQMVVAGTLTQDSHVWKQGMVDWEKANSVDEVNALFDGTMPPPIPTTK